MTKSNRPTKAILENHARDGLTTAQISKIYKRSIATVQLWFRDAGLNRITKPAGGEAFDRDAFLGHLAQGLSLAAIDRKYDRAPGSAYNYARTEGIIQKRPRYDIREDRVIRNVESSTGNGYIAVSLPLNSMHVQALQEKGA